MLRPHCSCCCVYSCCLWKHLPPAVASFQTNTHPYTHTHTHMSGHERKRKWAARAKWQEEELRKGTNRHCLPRSQLPLSIQFNSIQFHSSELSRVRFGLLFHFSCQSYCNCVKAFPVYILYVCVFYIYGDKK